MSAVLSRIDSSELSDSLPMPPWADLSRRFIIPMTSAMTLGLVTGVFFISDSRPASVSSFLLSSWTAVIGF